MQILNLKIGFDVEDAGQLCTSPKHFRKLISTSANSFVPASNLFGHVETYAHSPFISCASLFITTQNF